MYVISISSQKPIGTNLFKQLSFDSNYLYIV